MEQTEVCTPSQPRSALSVYTHTMLHHGKPSARQSGESLRISHARLRLFWVGYGLAGRAGGGAGGPHTVCLFMAFSVEYVWMGDKLRRNWAWADCQQRAAALWRAALLCAVPR